MCVYMLLSVFLLRSMRNAVLSCKLHVMISHFISVEAFLIV